MTEELVTNNQLIASELITENTKSYSAYILSHHFPHAVDGLKKVKRRILISQPVDTPFSGVSMVANSLKLHPYGDTATYETATRLTDVFRSEHQLLKINGTGGSYGGDRAAAARYTEFQLSEFCRDILFRDIDFKTIPTELTEDLSGYEIRYFVPKLPTSLLYDNESVGFGFNSRTYPLKFENVCTLVTDFIKSKDKAAWEGRSLTKLMVPYLPIHVNLINAADIVAAFRRGDYQHPIETEGIYQIVASNKVLFRTLHYGANVANVREMIETILRDKNHWAVKQFDATSDFLSEDVNYADFEITIKRNANIFEFVSRLTTAMHVRGKCYPKMNFVYQENMVNLSIPNLIRIWYKERYRSKLGTLKYKQQKLYTVQMKLEAQLIICDHTDEVIYKLRNFEREEVKAWLKERFELSSRQCDILLKVSVEILLKSQKSELTASLNATTKEIDEITEAFGNIDEDLVSEIKKLKAKYSSNSKFVSSEPDYFGCLIVGDLGIIQLRDRDELDRMSSIFNVDKRLVIYPTDMREIEFTPRNSYTKAAVPYTFYSKNVKLARDPKLRMFTKTKTRGILTEQGYVGADRSIIKYVSKDPRYVTNTGKICQLKDLDFDPCKGSVKFMFAFDPVPDENEYWAISANTGILGMIRIQRITLKSKIVFSSGGNTEILDIIPISQLSVIVQMPVGFKYNFVEVADMVRHAKDVTIKDVPIRQLARW